MGREHRIFFIFLSICLVIFILFIALQRQSYENSTDNLVSEDNIACSESDEVGTHGEGVCNAGFITIFDDNGVKHFIYSQDIVIENDGENGHPIEIHAYVYE